MTTKKAANAVAGRTARACDGCLRKRARWYCAADDAFLCQGCDSSVHSANQLASRHERVRLEKTGPKAEIGLDKSENSPPAWHRGFTRKARTPRHGKSTPQVTNPLPVVPEIGGEEASPEENEEQLLYRVPVFDPFDAELCRASNETENIWGDERESGMGGGLGVLMREKGHEDEACDDELDNLHGFLPSDMDLAEFAADVESLLGTGLDEDSCGIEGLGLLDCKEEDDVGKFLESRKVKVEDVDGVGADAALEFEGETMDWNFDYESPMTRDEEKVAVGVETTTMSGGCEEVKRKMILRLNYEGVISAWDRQGCPWTTGSRPELNPDDGWLDFMGWGATGYAQPCGGAMGGHVGGGDGGREARVSRYKEKRRTRLFSKKIRYEVRKLNAEKRPRMKGRFVKKVSFAALPPPHQGPFCIPRLHTTQHTTWTSIGCRQSSV
ncbi:zinc finger protein CONSTANS-LIKE 16-like isoform X2 [Actinidia eriantha]|uniref:zinc finger protein CONSTANS-LIKE 16-like isoform X2 n=1 Tax=Actinidia eriantha TaxID=165200 RepID=UPI002585DEF9|nr:zinc finger protein CONSTANS-LIKE 16-like isoform X2 [Actinidia eriantha]